MRPRVRRQRGTDRQVRTVYSLSAWSDAMVVWLEQAQRSILIDDSPLYRCFLNDGLCSLVSHADMHTHSRKYRHVSTLIHTLVLVKNCTHTHAPLWGDSVSCWGELSYWLIIGISSKQQFKQFDSLMILFSCLPACLPVLFFCPLISAPPSPSPSKNTKGREGKKRQAVN